MIESLKISSFKCFDEIQLRLGALTLLSGLNSSGKSSVMHSLAILYQTITGFESSQSILLNGSAISLGTVADVVCNRSSPRKYDFSVGVKTSNWEAEWTAGGVDATTASHAPLLSFKLRHADDLDFLTKGVQLAGSEQIPVFHLVPEDSTLPESYREVAAKIRAKLDGILYVSAERIGPRETYPIRLSGPKRDVGAQGEWAPWCLFNYGDNEVRNGLAIKGEAPTLLKQAGAWMSYFFPGAAFQVNQIAGTSLVKLEFRSSRSGGFHRPQNVGFALSQVLPILVACLIARENQLVLIENPEIHLHPAGQSEMGYFLSRVAASGVQIMIETHSDHVLNGIRKFVAERHIDSGRVAIHFFDERDAETGDLQDRVSELTIDDKGRIGNWPPGFFDQLGRDLLSLP